MPWRGPIRVPVDARWASSSPARVRAGSVRNSVTKFVCFGDVISITGDVLDRCGGATYHLIHYDCFLDEGCDDLSYCPLASSICL